MPKDFAQTAGTSKRAPRQLAPRRNSGSNPSTPTGLPPDPPRRAARWPSRRNPPARAPRSKWPGRWRRGGSGADCPPSAAADARDASSVSGTGPHFPGKCHARPVKCDRQGIKCRHQELPAPAHAPGRRVFRPGTGFNRNEPRERKEGNGVDELGARAEVRADHPHFVLGVLWVLCG